MGLDGYKRATEIDAAYPNPVNYTPASVGGEPTSHLSAHVKGMDAALGGSAAGGSGFVNLALPIGSAGQGTWAWYETDGGGYFHYHGGYWFNTSNAVTDNWTWKAWMGAGTWSLGFIYSTATNGGIIDVSVDGSVKINDLDLYGAASYCNVQTATGISIASAGEKDVKLEVVDKNVSSSGYYGWVDAIVLWRTA